MQIFVFLFLSAALLYGDVRLPALISDSMLLQRDVPVRIWGWSDPGEQITVSFQSQKVQTTAGTDGKWQAFLAPIKAGLAGEMTISGKNRIVVRDVLVGEVWVGSGQSNMQWTVARSDNAEQEISKATYPQLRLFQVKRTVADKPAEDVEGKWVACTPEAVKDFSAVAYFFGREIHQTQKVPVGMIHSSWGGTPAQAWTSGPALSGDSGLSFIADEWQGRLAAYPAAKEKYDRALQQWQQTKEGRQPQPPMGPGHPHTPSGLFNAMIAPLTPYAIRGAIWYQGESNANEAHAYRYRRLFRTMIEDWRQAWGIGQFPFLYVQLANFKSNGWWPLLRDSQTSTLGLTNTAMAVTIDIGNPADIHPTNKQDVGRRLALAARALVHGEKIEYSGPLYRQLTVDGSRARVWFDHTGGGLNSKGGALAGFQIAGKDGTFVPAEAKIDGATVVVWSSSVKDPTAVRYAWEDSPTANLYNGAGLPASPFRSVSSAER